MKKELQFALNSNILVLEEDGRKKILTFETHVDEGDDIISYFSDLKCTKVYKFTSDFATKNSLDYFNNGEYVKCILEYPDLLKEYNLKNGDHVSIEQLEMLEGRLNGLVETEELEMFK